MNMDIDDKLMNDFKDCVGFAVAQHYKKDGVIARQRLLWKLTKLWNSRPMHAGIPGEVRRKLGEQEATRLFQDIANEYIYNPELLKSAIDDLKKLSNPENDDKAESKTFSIKDVEQQLSKSINDREANIHSLALVIAPLINRGYKVTPFPDDKHTIGLSVQGLGKIWANKLPVTVESTLGGYDPAKCQTEDFTNDLNAINHKLKYVKCTYEHIEDVTDKDNEIESSMQLLADLNSLSNSGKISSFTETVIVARSRIDKLTAENNDDFINYVDVHIKEVSEVANSLIKYLFDPNDKELFIKACKEVIKAGKASTALLQRRLQISYPKADELMTEMSRRNIVLRHTDKPSEVLVNDISECQW